MCTLSPLLLPCHDRFRQRVQIEVGQHEDQGELDHRIALPLFGHDPERKLHGGIRNPDRVRQSSPMLLKYHYNYTGVADTCECDGNSSWVCDQDDHATPKRTFSQTLSNQFRTRMTVGV